MDPNAVLAAMRANAEVLREHDDPACADDLAASFQALDEWLTQGGFLPSEWASRRTGRTFVAREVEAVVTAKEDLGVFEVTATGPVQLDVLVNLWDDGTATTALQRSNGGQWLRPSPLVEESSG